MTMNYTVADMLKESAIPEIRTLAAGRDRDEKQIEAVTVQEYPADDFVQPGDLVLSAAEGLNADPARLCAFLEELAESGAAAVVFAFREDEVFFPPSAKAKANSLGLAVFCIPWRLRFAQVQSQLLRRIQRRSIENISEARLKADFVWDLACGNYDSLAHMGMLGKRLRFDLSIPYACLRMAVETDGLSEYSAKAAETAFAVESAAEAAARRCGVRVMCACRSMELIAFVEVREGRGSEGAAAYADVLRGMAADIEGISGIFSGLSSSPQSPGGFERLAQEAELALGYARRSRSGTYEYRAAREAAMVALLAKNDEAAAMARDILKAAIEDTKEGRALSQTLIAYFRSCCNASRAAGELGIHRLTLLQRLEKAEAVTGLSLKDHRDRFLMQLCLRLFYDI